MITKIRDIGNYYYKMHQAIEFQLSKPLFTALFSGSLLACTNLKIFVFVAVFTAIYLPLALRFFTKLASIEQAKQNSWYSIFGMVADCITNIFTVFSFASKTRELKGVENYYRNVHNPIAIKYYKYDLIISIILSLIYWAYLIAVFTYVIHLRNCSEISASEAQIPANKPESH